jgi:hypothetical protein
MDDTYMAQSDLLIDEVNVDLQWWSVHVNETGWGGSVVDSSCL